MSLVRSIFDFGALTLLHIGDYYFSRTVVERQLVPLLNESSEPAADIRKLNRSLYKLGINYRVPSQTDSAGDEKSKPRTEQNSTIGLANKALFNVTVSFSLQMIWLFLFDISGFMDTPMKNADYVFTLSCLTLLLSYLVPSWILQCWLYARKDRSIAQIQNTKRFVSTFLIILVGLIAILHTTSVILGRSFRQMGFLQGALYRLSFCGVCCMALLNGTGCVSSVFNLYYSKWGHITKEDITRVVRSLKTTDELIQSRLRSQEDSQLFSNELGILRGTRMDMIRQLNSLTTRYSIIHHSQDMSGWFRRVFELGLSCYCFYRVANNLFLQLPAILLSAIGLISSGKADSDPLSATLASLFITYINSSYDYDTLCVSIDIAFAVSLFICSFQGVALTFSKFRKVIHVKSETVSTKSSTSTSFKYLFELIVAEVTGVYVISTMTILDSGGLHSETQSGLFGASQLSAHFVNTFYNECFGLSAILTIAILSLMRKLENRYSMYSADDLDFYDEEKMVEKN